MICHFPHKIAWDIGIHNLNFSIPGIARVFYRICYINTNQWVKSDTWYHNVTSRLCRHTRRSILLIGGIVGRNWDNLLLTARHITLLVSMTPVDNVGECVIISPKDSTLCFSLYQVQRHGTQVFETSWNDDDLSDRIHFTTKRSISIILPQNQSCAQKMVTLLAYNYWYMC